MNGSVSPLDASPETPAPVLSVERLTVQRGTFTALEDVSFSLLPGTNTAVVGPNGAGKSTLVQAILGLIPYTAARIEILGRPLKRLGALGREIGYVPQNFLFDRGFPLVVTELVGLGWAPRSAAWRWPWQRDPAREAAIAQALRRVDAYHLRRQAIGTLSGGELKRVLLAYCLVAPRRLLVLDEAFAGLDVSGEADFYGLLHELQQEQNWAILQVSHDIDMVNRHCDRVLCLNRRLVCHDAPQTAFSSQNLLATYGPAFQQYPHSHGWG